MTENFTLTTERVDDIPLLLTQLTRMDVPSLLDQYFHQHGNWQGLPVGWVATVWLVHVLSQSDHRLNHVRPWAERRLQTLQTLLPHPLQSLDLTDDRLASVLRLLSDDAGWIGFERALTRTTLRVYDLRPARVRVDTTTSSGYWQVTEDGLFQFGHSKDHRPDLAQLKVLLATLDPLGMPVACEVLSGERADDPLYLPAIARVRSTLGERGLLYVGDCKMSSLATRAGIAFHRDYYLCPLSAIQAPPAVIAGYVAAVTRGEHTLQKLERSLEDGTREHLADGFEVSETLRAEHDTWPVSWTERRLVVRSLQQAKTAEQGWRKRLAQAQQALAALPVQARGKRRWDSLAALQQAAAAVVAHYHVAEVLQVTCREEVQERQVRAYGTRPATVRRTSTFSISTAVDAAALAAALAQCGWRVYVTNQPVEQLSVEQAVLAYREEYLVERSLGRLKGQPLSLRPMYLARADHATGLVRLLTIALRVLTVVEFVVRRALAATASRLEGLYAGQPTRATAQPTAERLLAAFREVTLTIFDLPGRVIRHLTPLTVLQQRILALLDCPPTIYTRLASDSLQPP
ncbi:MAG: IS1634 family transposase [Chloroflexi bacterium]|nr:IS1634 family transposase [Chloroflexota bacterium]